MEDKKVQSTKPSDPDHAVCLTMATFAWDVPQDSESKKSRKKRKSKTKRTKSVPVSIDEQIPMKLDDNEIIIDSKKVINKLFDISFTLKKGQLIGVCGAVGSGKSSLISAILGQMNLVRGMVAYEGRFAYVAQQAWIINATLRENILLGSEFNSKRYYAAISCCGLNPDLALLPSGDETEIGERGINLSGGQKQRISLARAVYSDRDIFLLDDPLSAVDAHVGKHIFENCIRETFKDKSVLFVTHQLQYLSRCDHVLFMKDGTIAEQGTHEELMKAKSEYSNLLRTFHENDAVGDEAGNSAVKDDLPLDKEMDIQISEHRENDRENSAEKPDPPTEADAPNGDVTPNGESGKRLITEEAVKEGSISWKTYLMYMKAAGGLCVSCIVVLSFVVNIGTTAFSSWWLSKWLNEGGGGAVIYDSETNSTYLSTSISDNPNMPFYQLIYGLCIIFILVTSFFRSFLFMKVTLKASSKLHDQLFARIIRCPMSFFDCTPIGRILNLFSVDMDEIDIRLPFVAETFLQNIWVILFSLLFVSMVFPYFLLILAVLFGLFAYLYTVFRVAIRQLKRLENVSRSPIYSHVTATIQGLPTIHAYEKEQDFINRFMIHFDNNTGPFFLFHCAMRWLGLRLDLFVISISVFTGLFVVLTHGQVTAAFAGLAMAYAGQLSGLFQYTVRLSTETEARFTCVERIQTYVQSLETEAPAVVEAHRPKVTWPSLGVVEFVNVSLRYRPNLPLILKDVTFAIQTKEKIGIVGRTGSGKSSLGVALFRLVELSSGNIFIDDIDIKRIGLEDLRSKMSLIPQDPVLFIGTVRYNLDPFNLYTDDQIWAALEKTYMMQKVKALDLELLALVVENGENFSVGERQLICMARALLRNCRILLLDEATAAIDTETDSLIQTTIREAFADCTILTIAHRLNTVLSCDRIIVLDDGKIVEMGKPSNLLTTPNSVFAQMMAVASEYS